MCDFQIVHVMLSGCFLAKGLDDPDFKAQSWLKDGVWRGRVGQKQQVD